MISITNIYFLTGVPSSRSLRTQGITSPKLHFRYYSVDSLKMALQCRNTFGWHLWIVFYDLCFIVFCQVHFSQYIEYTKIRCVSNIQTPSDFEAHWKWQEKNVGVALKINRTDYLLSHIIQGSDGFQLYA